FEPRRQLGVGQTPTSIATRDFNGDGLPDLAVVNSRSNQISVLKNRRASVGSIRFHARLEFGLNSTAVNPFSIGSGDFDRDGKQDLVTANRDSNNISVLKNLGVIMGDVQMNSSLEYTTGQNSAPDAVAVGDVDGDGFQDVVVANSGSASISALRNTS